MSKKRWYKNNILVDSAITLLESVLVRLAQKRLERPKDDAERINELLDLTHELFGDYVAIHSVHLQNGEREIQVGCRKCGRRNRLTHGFKNAVCGSCKLPLVRGAEPKTVN